MRTERIFCDRCKAECPVVFEAEVVIGREMDTSGNGYNLIHKRADLCPDCVNYYISFALQKGETL